MTTDKVRVEIQEKDVDFETFINNEALVKILFGKYPIIMGWIGISKSRDNWIDITLPEEIRDEKKYKVLIQYRDDSWQAVMFDKKSFQSREMSVYARNQYKLPVTVY
jgi:hypothetical protein